MRCSSRRALTASLIALAAAASLQAYAKAPTPIPTRVALAEVIVVGKVTAIEEKTVFNSARPNDGRVLEYQIAAIKIEDAIRGARGLTHLKVGFHPLRGGLSVGREVCLFLRPHHLEPFHVYATEKARCVLDKKDDGFAKEVGLTRRCVKLLSDPAAGLKAKEKSDRYLTAAMLLVRYRHFRAGPRPTQEVPIPAEESRLILKALAEADWEKTDPTLTPSLAPDHLFNLLEPGPKDGWVRPKAYREFRPAARKWLKENAGTYRIKRYVAAKKK